MTNPVQQKNEVLHELWEWLRLTLSSIGHAVITTDTNGYDLQAGRGAARYRSAEVERLRSNPKIREQPWGQKMVRVALTGWGQDEDRRKSSEAEFNGHLVKPVDHAAPQSCWPSGYRCLYDRSASGRMGNPAWSWASPPREEMSVSNSRGTK